MKRCPICQSLAFDDAITCYGCLHEFGSDEQPQPVDAAAGEVDALPDAPPAFLIRIKPERGRSGQTEWTCRVDLVQK